MSSEVVSALPGTPLAYSQPYPSAGHISIIEIQKAAVLWGQLVKAAGGAGIPVIVSGSSSASSQPVGANNYVGSQVSIPTTAGGTLLLAARATRTGAVIENLDAANPIYIGSSGVSSSTGFKIGPGQSLPVSTTAAVYAISTGGSVAVSLYEEWN